MKLPLSLIKSFIETDEKIADTLTMLGIEVDAISTPTPTFHGVVTATVKSVERHPSADKLQIAQVFDGKETVQVVCGAPNCRPGIIVAFAKLGAQVGDLKIVKASIRGVESSGMLCAASELQMYEDNCGEILELPTDTPLGVDCISLLWDPVFEISLTPNLGHCMSALGIARELSAALQKPLKIEKFQANTETLNISVKVENPDLCPRYTARLIEQVKIGPSPFWLQRQLKAAGLSSINNVVDATNYILLKYGQPMHAFDFDKIEGKCICVETTKKPTRFEALTGASLEIPAETLVIADANKPIAIAGVMGGANSAVTASTQNILLEAASFDPIAVRLASKNTAILDEKDPTSRKLGLRTDSSLRFEKGVDPASIPHFLDIAANLIAEISGGKVSPGAIDCKKEEFKPKKILCRPGRVNQILGTKLSESEIHSIFQRLGFKVADNVVEVPLSRGDISEEIDLIEEVARIYGYNNIGLDLGEKSPVDGEVTQYPRHLPKSTTPQLPNDRRYLFETEVRSRLIGLGLQEILNCDLISPKLAEAAQEFAKTKNTLLHTLHSKSEEYSVLRPSMLPGLLQTVRTNIDQRTLSLSVFELGRIHFQEQGSPVEYPMIAVLLTGKHAPHHWDRKPSDADFFDAKGLVENLLEGLRIPQVTYTISNHPTFHPSRQIDLSIGSNRIGSIGEVHPHLLAKFDIKQKVYYAELNAQQIQEIQRMHTKMKPLAQFPGSERDLTLSIPTKTNISTIFEMIKSLNAPLLEHFELIDLFNKEEISNATFRFSYRDRTKTVLFEEVEAAHQSIMQELLAKTKPHI